MQGDSVLTAAARVPTLLAAGVLQARAMMSTRESSVDPWAQALDSRSSPRWRRGGSRCAAAWWAHSAKKNR